MLSIGMWVLLGLQQLRAQMYYSGHYLSVHLQLVETLHILVKLYKTLNHTLGTQLV
jgi:hypothetical protein